MKKAGTVLLLVCMLFLVACKHEHEFGSWESVKEASCEETGIKERRCKCGETEQEVIPALGHRYEEKIIKEATCSEEGVKMQICSVCDKTETEPIPMMAHTFIEDILKDATCAEKGEKLLTCTVCGFTETESVDNESVPHEYSYVMVEDPSCIKEGQRIATCMICGEEHTETVPKADHQYKVEIIQEPTCIDKGEMSLICEVCGESHTEELDNKGAPHQFVAAVSKAPTCVEEGIRTNTCAFCGMTTTESIEKVSHQYVESVIKQPSCAEEGEKEIRCSVCGDSHKEVVPRNGDHTTAFGTCSRCGSVVTALKDNATSIKSSFLDGINQINKTLDYCSAALNSSHFSGTATAVASFALSSGKFQNAIDACGNYPEFANVKNELSAIKSSISNTFSGNVSVYGDARDLNTIKAIVKTLDNVEGNILNVQNIMKTWPAY